MKEQKVLLLEDDFLNRRLSRKTLIENEYLVFEAKNVKEALAILHKESIDIAILDINLGAEEQDGISFGQQLNDHFSIPFIYLTAYENAEVISRAVHTKPYSYLTKPFKTSDLLASIDVALTRSADRRKYQPTILVKDDDYNVNLPIKDIEYIESRANYLFIYVDNKVYKCRGTIAQILEKLPASSFIQTHRAYVVNKNKIEKFTTKYLIIKSAMIPVSKNYSE